MMSVVNWSAPSSRLICLQSQKSHQQSKGLEAFSLNDPTDDSEDTGDDNEYLDADSFFNLPGDDGDEQPDV